MRSSKLSESKPLSNQVNGAPKWGAFLYPKSGGSKSSKNFFGKETSGALGAKSPRSEIMSADYEDLVEVIEAYEDYIDSQEWDSRS